MAKTRIAIACQGGGSQTAFTAGALKTLCDANLGDQFEVVSISGTSGGALCATLIWYAYMKGETPLWGRLMDFWKANTAQTWMEQTLNTAIVESLRLVNSGMLPSFQTSPSAMRQPSAIGLAALGLRPEFMDFRALLERYIDFAEIASWGPMARRPVLILGAANVTTGDLAKFVSWHEPIRVEHILASCAVPNLFPAVQIGPHAYWDGLFSDNPPIGELVRPRSIGAGNVPEEIWLIKINPTGCPETPVRPDAISDRRNQLEGNISLFQQLSHLESLNDMINWDAFRPEFLAELGIQKPIRMPKSFETDPDKPYHIPCIEMPTELQDMLDLKGKIDRGPANINRLIAEGEAAALRFLDERGKAVASPPMAKGPPDWKALRLV